jgi:hypothetical protein
MSASSSAVKTLVIEPISKTVSAETDRRSPLVAALSLRRYPKTVPSRAEHVKLRRDVRLLPGHVRIRVGIRAAANGIKRVI